MVDSSAVIGHDALQQPSWPQAQRRASHRQHDGSQADKVKNHKRRQGRGLPHGPHLVMLFSVSAAMAQHRLGSPEKSRGLSKRLSFTSSFFQLQRLSSERTQVRHRLNDAEQSSVIPAVRRPEQSDTISSFILDTALRQNISSKRHSSSGCANGTTGLPRRMGCAGQQSRSSDVLESSETRHQCQAEFVRRPFRRGGHSLSTGRPPFPKGSEEDRAKCFKGLESTTPLRPQQELEELRLKKENGRKQQTWNQSPKGMTKHRQSQKTRKTKGSKARTSSQNLLGQTPKQLVNSQEPSFRKASSGRNGTRVLHRLGACFMVPSIDYPRYVHLGALMPRQSDFDSICKLCARKGSEVAQGDSDVTQTPRTASDPRAISDRRTTVSVTLSIPKIANIQSLCPDDTPRCQSTPQRVQCWPQWSSLPLAFVSRSVGVVSGTPSEEQSVAPQEDSWSVEPTLP